MPYYVTLTIVMAEVLSIALKQKYNGTVPSMHICGERYKEAPQFSIILHTVQQLFCEAHGNNI